MGRATRRRRRGLHGRLLHREDGLLGLRLLHEELLLLHGDHHLLPARERRPREPDACRVYDEPGDYQMACVKQAVVRHLPAIDATEGKDEVAVLCDKLCDDIRAGLLEAIDKACPGQPAYILGGIQINGPTEGPELLAIRHFELRAPDGTLTDKMAALERALDLQVNGFN